MRNTRKGVVIVAVALTAFGLALTGCSSSSGGSGSTSASASGVSIDADHSVGAMDNYAVGTTFKATQPIDISMLYRDHSNYPEQPGWLIFSALQANQNVTFNLTKVPLSDWQTKRSQYITTAANEPEVMPVFYSGEETQYVNSGALLPISDYVQYMPNFQKDLQDFGLSSYLDTKRQADGKYYQLPGLMQSVILQYSILVRDDKWQAAGLTSDPTNLTDLQTDLQKLKDTGQCQVPLTAGNNAKDILQAWSPNYNTLVGDWAIQNGAQMWDASQNKYVGAATQPGAQDLTKYMAGLVSAGLMDKDSMTQGTNDNSASDQKLENGTACAVTGNYQDLARLQTALNASGNNTTMHMLTLPQSSDGKTYITGGQRFSSGMVFGASLKNDPHFLAILQFIDWLYYSPEGVEFAQWGVQCPQGVTDDTQCTYTKDANGNRQLLPTINNSQGLNPAAGKNAKMLNTDYGFSNGVFWPANGTFDDLIMSYLPPAEQNFMEREKDVVERPTAPSTPLDSDALEDVATYAQQLRDTQNQWTTDFIVGNKDPNTQWSDYQAALQAAGLDKLVQIYNDNVKK